MMNNITSKDGYFDIDLEKGRETASDNLIGNEERGFSSVDLGTVKLTVVDEKDGEGCREKIVKEKKPKAMTGKKPPKPPRPPRGLSLDSADQKLIRELNELARLKRARIERMKALKKSKEAKALSSKNQLFATLLTVLFCIVFLIQGISSRNNSAVNLPGSPISSGVIEGMDNNNIISVQQYPFSSTTGYSEPTSESPRLVERVSGFDTEEQVSRASG